MIGSESDEKILAKICQNVNISEIAGIFTEIICIIHVFFYGEFIMKIDEK